MPRCHRHYKGIATKRPTYRFSDQRFYRESLYENNDLDEAEKKEEKGAQLSSALHGDSQQWRKKVPRCHRHYKGIKTKPKMAMHETIGISIGAATSEQNSLEICVNQSYVKRWRRRWGGIRVLYSYRIIEFRV